MAEQIDRAAFEAWERDDGGSVIRNDDDTYRNTGTAEDWRVWQAALQSQAADHQHRYTHFGDQVMRRCIDCNLPEQAATIKELTDQDPNAPWLSEAHALCADMGIPPGHITDRIRALREKLGAAEPVGVVDEDDDGLFADFETALGVVVKRGDKLYATPPDTQADNWNEVEAYQAVLHRALVALKCHMEQTRPIQQTMDVIAELESLGVKA